MIIHYFSQDTPWVKSTFKVKHVFLYSIKLRNSLSSDLRTVNIQIALGKFKGQDIKHSIPYAA